MDPWMGNDNPQVTLCFHRNDTELLRETYDTFNRELTSRPLTPREAIVNMLQLIAESESEPRAAKANPDDFVENRFMQNLEARLF